MWSDVAREESNTCRMYVGRVWGLLGSGVGVGGWGGVHVAAALIRNVGVHQRPAAQSNQLDLE